MKRYFIVLLGLWITGCATLETRPPTESRTASDIRKDLTPINKIKTGMPKSDVISLMNHEVVVGYRQSETAPEAFEAITLKNPLRAEDLSRNGQIYYVLYYYTHVVKPDGEAADNEMTPIVLDNERVIGKGWNDLYRLKQTL